MRGGLTTTLSSFSWYTIDVTGSIYTALGWMIYCPKFVMERRNLSQALEKSIKRESIVTEMLKLKKYQLLVSSAIVKMQNEL